MNTVAFVLLYMYAPLPTTVTTTGVYEPLAGRQAEAGRRTDGIECFEEAS